MIIITAGNKYTDIDVLASCYAYKKLFDLQNIPAKCVLPGNINETVSKSMRDWDVPYETTFPTDIENMEFILIDVSNPKYFSQFVKEENIIELFDHHFGFEGYWKEKLGENSHIEHIGACATQIWGKYKEVNLQEKVDTTVANLLYTTIISHTLNFESSVTTNRDKIAVGELEKYISLPTDWIETYFKEVEESVLEKPLETLKNDTKTQDINDKSFFIAQLELWDSNKFISENKKLIVDYINSATEDFAFFTSPSISEGKNYLLARDENTKELLEKVIGADFSNEIGTTPKLLLRKEIIKKILES